MIEQAPGAYRDVPDETYHRWAGASSSRLGALKTSPAHALFQMTFPSKMTETLKRGSALHTKVLQPERFAERWIVADRKTCPDDGVTLGTNVMAEVSGMAAAIAAHSVAAEILADRADRELSIVWDNADGVRCKARFDHLCLMRDWIVDIKTTQDASFEAFTKSIHNYGYHRQGSHYLEAAAAAGINAKHFVIIAVEATASMARDGKPAHGVAVYALTPEALDAGALELHELMQVWRECCETGNWPGYPTAIQDIGLPEWAAKKHRRES